MKTILTLLAVVAALASCTTTTVTSPTGTVTKTTAFDAATAPIILAALVSAEKIGSAIADEKSASAAAQTSVPAIP